jgi:hypothetical protein
VIFFSLSEAKKGRRKNKRNPTASIEIPMNIKFKGVYQSSHYFTMPKAMLKCVKYKGEK